jgi:hypothetical protein
MRQIVDAIAVQIKIDIVVPQIADTVHCPSAARHIGGASLDRGQVARENVLAEVVAFGIRTKPQPDVIVRHPVADDFVLVALIERELDRVHADLVSFQAAAIRRLKDQAVSAVTAIDKIWRGNAWGRGRGGSPDQC